jgi:hypothetical protein
MLLILGSPCAIAGTRHLSRRKTRVTAVPPKLVRVVDEGVRDVPCATVHETCSADQRSVAIAPPAVGEKIYRCMRGEGDKGGVRYTQGSAQGAWYRLYFDSPCYKALLTSHDDLCGTTSNDARVWLHLTTQLPMGRTPRWYPLRSRSASARRATSDLLQGYVRVPHSLARLPDSARICLWRCNGT